MSKVKYLSERKEGKMKIRKHPSVKKKENMIVTINNQKVEVIGIHNHSWWYDMSTFL